MKVTLHMFYAVMALTFSFYIHPLFAAPPHPSDDRIWTGVNGATFRGVYARSINQGGKIEFLTSSGKVVTVAFGNLSEKDQAIILAFEGKPTDKKAAVSDNDAFKELPLADRVLIPERDPEDFGGTDDESIVDAIWVSLLWWNAFEVMPIPKSGDFERKAEWLHKELTRHLSKGGKSSTKLEEAKGGLVEYFEKRLKDIGTCKVTVNHEELDPANLSKITKGNNIVILKMSMTYASGNTYSITSSLESVEEDGTVALHFFGKRFTGKMVVTEGTAKQPPHKRSYELQLNDRLNLPQYYQEQEPRFYIRPGSWQGTLLIEPYIYKTLGEPAPIPG